MVVGLLCTPDNASAMRPRHKWRRSYKLGLRHCRNAESSDRRYLVEFAGDAAPVLGCVGHRANAARQVAACRLADLSVEERPEGRIGCRHPCHVAVAAAIAGCPRERADGGSARGLVDALRELLSIEFLDYRPAVLWQLRGLAAAARRWRLGGAGSKSRTRPVRRRIGPSNTCLSGNPCRRRLAGRDVAVFHGVVQRFAATQRWSNAFAVQAPVFGGVLAGEVAKNVRRHVRHFR